MEKVGKNEFVYLWITNVGRLELTTRCSLLSGTFFSIFIFNTFDLHNSYFKCVTIVYYKPFVLISIWYHKINLLRNLFMKIGRDLVFQY